MAADVEEGIVAAHGFEIEHFAEDACEELLGRRRGGDSRRRGRGAQRRGEGASIELAVRRQRECVQPDQRRRQHVVGQFARGPAADLGELRPLRAAGQRVGDHALVSRTILAHDAHATADVPMGGDGGLDLAEFHAVAAQLDLVVEPPQHLDAAIGAPARHVAGVVEAVALDERIGDEALCRQLLPVQVAASDACAAQAQLARHARGQGLLVRIEDVGPHVVERAADGDVGGVVDAGDGRPDGRLGGAVQVPQLRAAGPQQCRQVGRQRFAAAEHLEPCAAGPASVDDHAPRRRRGLHRGDVAAIE